MSAKVIDTVPQFMLAAAVNALGLRYRMLRYTPRMRELSSSWQCFERMSMDEIKAYQLTRLKNILRIAAKTPFYEERFKAAGLNVERVTSIDDLNALPVTTREDIRDHAAEMTLPDKRNQSIERRSSGTTGQSISYRQRSQHSFDYAYAALYQFYNWHGVAPLCRRATLAGRYMGNHKDGVAIRNWFENQLLLGVHALTKYTAGRYLEELRKFKPELLQAHPSAMLQLRELANSLQLDPIQIPAVAFTGETLLDSDRDELMAWFRGSVFGTYGSGEQHVFAAECEALNGYHIHPVFSVTSLKDSPVGKQIVSTSLINDVMPLIQYQIGDLADQIDSTPCSCGRTWPRILGLQGRADDVLLTASGEVLSPVVLRTGIAANFPNMPPWTIVQHMAPKEYTLQVFTTDDAADFKGVSSYLINLLGDGTQLNIERLSPQAHFSNRGKHRMIVRENKNG